MYRPTTTGNGALQLGGILAMGFSVVMAALFLFVIPASCTWVLAIELLGLGMLFIAGAVALILGKTIFR